MLQTDDATQNNDATDTPLDENLLSHSTTSTTDTPQSSAVLSGPNRTLPRTSMNKRLKTTKSTAVVDKADRILNVVSKRLNDPGDDEFSNIEKNVAMKLRKLPNETRIHTEKLINDLLYHAELGKITENTRITSIQPLREIPSTIQPTPYRQTTQHRQETTKHQLKSYCKLSASNNNGYQFPNVVLQPTTGIFLSGFNPEFDDA